MSTSSFKVKNGLTLTPVDLTTLVDPQSGDIACDINDNNKVKRFDEIISDWVELGAGGTDISVLYQEIFETGLPADYVVYEDAPGDVAVSGVNPLGDSYSLVIAQGDNGFDVATLDVPPLFRGQEVECSFYYESDLSEFFIYVDAGASFVTVVSSTMGSTAGGVKLFSRKFIIPADATTLSWGMGTSSTATGTQVKIDNIQLKLTGDQAKSFQDTRIVSSIDFTNDFKRVDFTTFTSASLSTDTPYNDGNTSLVLDHSLASQVTLPIDIAKSFRGKPLEITLDVYATTGTADTELSIDDVTNSLFPFSATQLNVSVNNTVRNTFRFSLADTCEQIAINLSSLSAGANFTYIKSIVISEVDVKTTIGSGTALDAVILADVGNGDGNNPIIKYSVADTTWQFSNDGTTFSDFGSGTGGGTSDPDALLIQNFDTSTTGDFFAQDGLEFAILDSLHGEQSAKLPHDTLNDVYFTQVIAVPPKFRGVNLTASVLLRSTASEGNVTFEVYDYTNSAVLTSQSLQTDSQTVTGLSRTSASAVISGFTNSVINELEVGMSVSGEGVPAGTRILSISTSALTITLTQNATSTLASTASVSISALPKTLQLGFNIPANCENIGYTVTGLPEQYAETYIDDVCFKNYFLGTSVQGQSEIQVPVITEWQSYTPTFTNFGTVTAIDVKWRQVGSNVEIQGKATAGTSTGSAYSISLPNSYTTATLPTGTLQVGSLYRSASSEGILAALLAESGQSTLGVSGALATATGNNPFTEVGTALGVGETFSIQASIPISGLSATDSITVNEIVPARSVLGNTTIDVPVLTDWAAYTPTFTGFGTPTNVEAQWRRNGENVEVRGKFTAGTATAVEARVSLPNGYTSASTSSIPSIQIVGKLAFDFNSATYFSSSVLIEPSVSYMTFGVQTSSVDQLTKTLASAFGTGAVISFFASVPVTGLTATEEIVVSGTQSALIQQPDTMIRLQGAAGYGSTNTRIRRFTNLLSSVGSDVIYQSSATLGDSFTIVTSGIYDLSLVDFVAGVNETVGISKNSNQLSTGSGTITPEHRLTQSSVTAANTASAASWSGYLVAGDIIRVHNNYSSAGAANDLSTFTISKQGSLKVASVNADQKITIPTSELRFEGASSRGATDTAIVKFDTMSKIRGDAFTVVNTAANGTVITMKKAGKLDISTSLFAVSGTYVYIGKNQGILISTPNAADIIATGGGSDAADPVANASATISVNVGDVLRVSTSAAITLNAANVLTLYFQEQSVQVSVSNTLPQFSESDSCVRVTTVNGYGSTATKIRRFSNLSQNIGTDVEYTDSATLGASFVAKTSGIYSISYTDSFSSATQMGITRNQTSLTTNVADLSANEILAADTTAGASYEGHASWTGYLVAGDVIRAGTHAQPVGEASNTSFTMSKVGKPNVTGVDVTPFVSIPQPLSQYSAIRSTVAVTPTSNLSTLATANTGSGIYSLSASGVTILKKCTLNISLSGGLGSGTLTTAYILKNGAYLALDTARSGSAASNYASVSVEVEANVGDVFTLDSNGAGSTSDMGVKAFVTAEALSDQILTVPETFSSDTAAFTYAGSATYTLATLANAPVGTYITYTIPGSSNVPTQTNAAPPTQSSADMNTNGLRLYTKNAYTAASVSATPSKWAIQIGKGHKGVKVSGYVSANKVTAVNLDLVISGTTIRGLAINAYDEVTGVLVIDASHDQGPSHVSWVFTDVNGGLSATSAYLVINASKNPALTGMNVNRVAARGVSSSGQSIPNSTQTTVLWDSDKSFDTHGALNTTTGVFTCPETGYYQANAGLLAGSFVFAAGEVFDIYFVKNTTNHSSSRLVAQASSTISASITISDTVFLTKGDTLKLGTFHNSGAAVTLNAASTFNFFSIAKIGN